MMTQSDNLNNAQISSSSEKQVEQEQDIAPSVDNKEVDKIAFAPYKNDHQSMQVGELVFENQTDKVIVYGDIDIFKNEKGLEQALKLQQVFSAIVEELQYAQNTNALDKAVTKEANVSEQTQSSKMVDNPFS